MIKLPQLVEWDESPSKFSLAQSPLRYFNLPLLQLGTIASVEKSVLTNLVGTFGLSQSPFVLLLFMGQYTPVKGRRLASFIYAARKRLDLETEEGKKDLHV